MRGKLFHHLYSNFSSKKHYPKSVLQHTQPYWMKNSWIVLWTVDAFENFHADGTKPVARD